MPPDLEHKSREELALEIVSLRHQVSDLSRMLFGGSSERFEGGGAKVAAEKKEGGGQAQAVPQTRKKEVAGPVKIHPGRAPLPESLERRDVFVEPRENVEGMKCIGEEATEELVYGNCPSAPSTRACRPPNCWPKSW